MHRPKQATVDGKVEPCCSCTTSVNRVIAEEVLPRTPVRGNSGSTDSVLLFTTTAVPHSSTTLRSSTSCNAPMRTSGGKIALDIGISNTLAIWEATALPMLCVAARSNLSSINSFAMATSRRIASRSNAFLIPSCYERKGLR